MMLRWLGVKADDEIIVPAYTYSATALAVLHAGAKPVMVDSGTDFNISVDAIRNAITSKPKLLFLWISQVFLVITIVLCSW